MASLLFPALPTSVQQNPKFTHLSLPLSSPKPTSAFHLCFFSNRATATNNLKCDAFPSDIAQLVDQSLSQVPLVQSGYERILGVAEELTEMQKWEVVVFGGLTWVYLTARPGVLIGAIDAYVLAPLQVGLDSLSGRRRLKGSDFLIGERVGEGSFGVVYAGVVVPKNVKVEERVQKRGRGKRALDLDGRFKEKVILKQVSHWHPEK